jgi:hypothetical protein
VTASPLGRNWTSARPQAPGFEVLSEHQPVSQWQFRYVVQTSAQAATQCKMFFAADLCFVFYMILAGLKPAIFGSEDQRLTH